MVEKCLSDITTHTNEIRRQQDNIRKNLDSLSNFVATSHQTILSIEDNTMPTARTIKTVTKKMDRLAIDYQHRLEVMDVTVDFLRSDFSSAQQDHATMIKSTLDREIRDMKRAMDSQ